MANSPNTEARGGAEPPELNPGTLIEGRYRVVRLIGVGGTGVVYEVEHLRTAQRLALKTLLDPAHAARLEQEARALARLRSPHVVKVVDLGRCEAGPYFVMTLLEGQTLRHLLEAKLRLGMPFIANLCLQVAEGLAEAHRVGLVHRDLKPDNLHLADATAAEGAAPRPPGDLCHVTVFDFGVVKLSAGEATSQLTRTGSTVGTPYYMSLEQLRGAGTVDATSDVYALSVVLYEALAGGRPFEAGTLGDLIFAICSTTPPSLHSVRPDLPKDVCDVIMRGLSREKTDRPKTMREFASAFVKHGDPGFTLWLRRPEPAASTQAAPAAVGIVHRAPRMTERLSAGGPPLGAVPRMPIENPDTDTSVDGEATSLENQVPRRDTPTGMYVRDLHGDGPNAAISAKGLPAEEHLGPGERTAGLSLGMPGAPGSGVVPAAPVSSGGAPVPMFGPPPVSAQSGSGSAASGPQAALAYAPPARSAFEEKLDRVLTDLGRRGNDLGRMVLVRFRSASQEQQIVVVILVTALIAVLVVGFGYAIIV